MIQNIQDIKEKADIVEVIQSFIPLRKNGANYISKCPFHDENTPSFVVNQRKNIFHCFGCNEGGNAIDFVMKYEKIDFVNAVLKVANICNVEVQENKIYSKKDLDCIEIQERLEILCQRSTQKLLQHDKLCQYLEKRGIKRELFSVYKLGLCLDKQEVIKIMGYEASIKIGLITDKGYLFFANRLLFFICNAKGHIVGISGRIHHYNNFTKSPKYINSKESMLYKKSQILYNLHFALQIMKEHKKNEMYIVEGYIDALTCNLLGIPSVALCGTAFNTNHLTLINKYIDEKTKIYLALDSDKAGIEATIRAYKTLLQYGFIEIKVARLRGHKDLNEFYTHSIIASEAKQVYHSEVEIKQTSRHSEVEITTEEYKNKSPTPPFIIYEALPFCLETEINNATTIAEKKHKLAFYTNIYKKSQETFIKQYMLTYLKKYTHIQEYREQKNTLYNVMDEEFILTSLANDREKAYLAQSTLQSIFFSNPTAFLDIVSNHPTANMRKYMLLPYVETDINTFHNVLMRYKILCLQKQLKRTQDVKQKILFSQEIQKLKKELSK